MTNTNRTFTDIEAKLILKAARRYDQYIGPTRAAKQSALEALFCYAEVASDVLGMCMAPAAFEQAIRNSLSVHPIPKNLTASRETAQVQRAQWQENFLASVASML